MKDWTPRTSFVTSPDGVGLAVYEAGNPAGRPLLFIHGFSQCSMCWVRQFGDPQLRQQFRLVAFDIRGHGGSDMPSDSRYYSEDSLFASDVHAVMAALNLARPVIIGWSYAGRIIGDYVTAFGTGNLAGINYVCARTNNDPSFNGPGTGELSGMVSADVARNIAATRAFLAACFAVAPSREDFETALAYNMLVPPGIRAAHLGRPPDDGAVLGRIDIPVLVTQGAEDLLVSRGLGELTASLAPGAELSIYEGIGHSPFVEDTARFNQELAAFATAAFGRYPA